MTARVLQAGDPTSLGNGVPPLAAVDELEISARNLPVVRRVSLVVHPGELLAVVGESGSGKTMLARSLLRLLPEGCRVTGGRVTVGGRDVADFDQRELQQLRGGRIGLVFQEPMTALNPALKVGTQLLESLRAHRPAPRDALRSAAVALLEQLGVPDPAGALERYPHQFSGGIRQRLMLASVLLPEPALIIADEPTTALDALIQQEVMDLFVSVARQRQVAVLMISHDLSVVADYADRVGVMHAGELVESGTTAEVLERPRHPVTRRLLEALPRDRRDGPAAPPSGDPAVAVRAVTVSFPPTSRGLRRRRFLALHEVSLTASRGEVLAIVGESGSGKSTLGRVMLGLQRPDAGAVTLGGRNLATLGRRDVRRLRPRYQLVFQDPHAALDPRLRIRDAVAEAMRGSGLPRGERHRRVLALLDEVGLQPAHAERFPHQLSGGQRQRVCIARALASDPELLVADEPVAALDLTVQRQILELLERLKHERGFTLVFISHDLAVVAEIADRIAVMCRGRLLELAPTRALLEGARHPYTQRLLQAAPFLRDDGDGYRLARRSVAPQPAPPGRHYYPDRDLDITPETAASLTLSEVESGHWVAVTDAVDEEEP